MKLDPTILPAETRGLLSRFAHVESEPLRQALIYWLSLCRPEHLPDREAFDPDKLSTIKDNCWMVERVDDGFIYRSAGADISATYSAPLEGRTLEQVTDPDAYPRVNRYFHRTLDTPCATHVTGRLYSERLDPVRGERLMLPLCAGDKPAFIFGVTVHNLALDGKFRYAPNRQVLTHTPIFRGPASVVIRAL